jgi:hypothetical protein
MLPWWLWWLFVPIGAAVIVGTIGFVVGHGIRMALPHHDPGCGCEKCDGNRRRAQAVIDHRKNETKRRAKYQGDAGRNARSVRRPQGQIVNTIKLSQYIGRLVGADNGEKWRVSEVRIVVGAPGGRGRGYRVTLKSITDHRVSQVIVPIIEADRPRWWLVSDR